MCTHLRVLSKSYPMNTNMAGVWWLSKIIVFLCFGQKSPQQKGFNLSEQIALIESYLPAGRSVPSVKSTTRENVGSLPHATIFLNYIFDFSFLMRINCNTDTLVFIFLIFRMLKILKFWLFELFPSHWLLACFLSWQPLRCWRARATIAP